MIPYRTGQIILNKKRFPATPYTVNHYGIIGGFLVQILFNNSFYRISVHMADWLCLLFMLYFFSSNYLDIRLSLFSLGIIRTSSIPFSLNRSLLPLFLGYSYPLLTLGLPSAWLLEGLSNLSRTSPEGLGLLSATSILGLRYAYLMPTLRPCYSRPSNRPLTSLSKSELICCVGLKSLYSSSALRSAISRLILPLSGKRS